MRQMTETERFYQIMVDDALREGYMNTNTSPMAEYESDNTPVHKIRYNGTNDDRPNTFSLWSD